MTSYPDVGSPRAFLQRQRRLLEQAEPSAWVARHEGFLRALAALPARCFDGLDPRALAEYSRYFRQCHLRYLTQTEGVSCRAALEQPALGVGDLLRQVFGAGAELWQRELSQVIAAAEGRSRRLVMVGSGPLPATLLWLAERHPEVAALGLDSNAAALREGEALARRLGASVLRFQAVDGVHHDYRGVDLVYVANQVSPKLKILERIQATADRDLDVIVRDPYENGWLLAEPVLGELPEAYTLIRTGAVSPVYLSRDLVLRLDGERAACGR